MKHSLLVVFAAVVMIGTACQPRATIDDAADSAREQQAPGEETTTPDGSGTQGFVSTTGSPKTAAADRATTSKVATVANVDQSLVTGSAHAAELTALVQIVAVSQADPVAVEEFTRALYRLREALDVDAVRRLAADDPELVPLAEAVAKLETDIDSLLVTLESDGTPESYVLALAQFAEGLESWNLAAGEFAAQWDRLVGQWEAAWTDAVIQWEGDWQAAVAEWQQEWTVAVAGWEQNWADAAEQWEQNWADAAVEWEAQWATAVGEWEQAWASASTEWEQAWADAAAEWEAEWANAAEQIEQDWAVAAAEWEAQWADAAAEWEAQWAEAIEQWQPQDEQSNGGDD